MRKRRIKRILAIFGSILGIFVLGVAVIALIQIDLSNDGDLDMFIEKKMKKARVQGLAALILKDGEIIWSGNYGYADTATSRKITDDTIFQIASVSKTVTGTAVMQLYERGLVDLDVSIETYLPFRLENPHFPDDEISLRMLLQHKSSLIDNEPVLESTYTIESGLGDPDVTLEEFVRAYYLEDGGWYDAEKNFLQARPGATFSYSNAAFGLLGYIVERVTGQAFHEYCNEHIFSPLGMTSTGWLITEVDLEKMTVHYENGTKPLQPYSFATYPDGALKTTTQDYAKFLLAIMNGGSYHGRRILQASTVEEMLPEDYTENLVWGANPLSFFLIDTGQHTLHGHSGGDPGIFTLVYFNPVNDTGVVFFMNSTPPLNFRVVNVISLMKRLNRVAQIY